MHADHASDEDLEMTKTFCDGCGKELHDREHVQVDYEDAPGKRERMDLCRSHCYSHFTDYMAKREAHAASVKKGFSEEIAQLKAEFWATIKQPEVMQNGPTTTNDLRSI